MYKSGAFYVIFFGFLLRMAVSTWNGLFGPSVGADMDALDFHNRAIFFYGNSSDVEVEIGWVYSYILGFVYRIFWPSILIGSFLSSVAWLISCLYIIKVAKLVNVDYRWMILLLVAYAFSPSSIIYTSVTLRESYQLLFVNAATYYYVNFYVNRRILNIPMFMISILFAGYLHGALAAFGAVFFIVMACTVFFSVPGKKSLKNIIITSCFAVLFVIPVIGSSYNIEDDIVSSAQEYQENVINANARTNYKNISFDSGYLDLVLGFLQYMVEPLPWRSMGLLDMPVVIENCLRVYILFIIARGVRVIKSTVDEVSIIVLFMYLFLEVVWSLGTVNWGTASRHHIPAFGVLVIAAITKYTQQFNSGNTGEMK